MRTKFVRSVIGILAVAIVGGAAVLLSGCSGSDDGATGKDGVASPISPAGGASLSSVAPDTFLTFEGSRYRLVDLQQADLIDDSAFEEAGIATEADIDQEDLTVYRKPGDTKAVYTFAPEQAALTETAGSEGESGAVPALWYRWTLEP